MTASLEWDSLLEEQREIIKKHHNEFPVSVGSIAKEFGIDVKASTLPAGISGTIQETNGSFFVRINRHDVKARQRFTVAHEIAHFLLHKDFIGDGITDDVLYRSKLSDVLEAQANRLAADIIMPWHLIEDSLSRNSDIKGEKKYETISDEANVSTTAIKIRLGKI